MRRTAILLVIATLLTVLGCQRTKGPVPVYSVKGQVLYGGAPAEGVRVYFFPINAPTVPEIPANPRGITDRAGRFELGTYLESDGAAEGEYLVILLWPAKTEQREESPADRLLGWYDAAHTKLNARIVAGENNLAPFELAEVHTPPPASEGIPGRN